MHSFSGFSGLGAQTSFHSGSVRTYQAPSSSSVSHAYGYRTTAFNPAVVAVTPAISPVTALASYFRRRPPRRGGGSSGSSSQESSGSTEQAPQELPAPTVPAPSTTPWVLIGGGTLLVVGIGYLVYRNSKKKG